MRTICFMLTITATLAMSSIAQAQSLLLVSASYGKNVVALCERDGTVLWKFKTLGGNRGHAGHHEVQMLDNGNILFHDDWQTVKEMKLDGTVVWSYKSSDVHAFTRLADGNTMIAESGTGRILLVDKAGKLVSETPLGKDGRGRTRQAEVLENGNYLVCAERPGTVTEYNKKGDIVWEYEIKTRVYGAIRLKNGNTLIGSGSGHSVVEVSPEKKVVWEIKDTVPNTKIKLVWTACLKELPNGHLIIGNCHAGEDSPQVFELDKNRKVVWEFNEFDLVGNGMACWDFLDAKQAAKVRKQVAALPKKK
jgi:outer membrane protein assembly factor BamB